MFKIHPDKVTWNNRPVKGADQTNFRILADKIGCDEKTVYVNGRPTKFDAASFEVLSPGYARDKISVYRISQTKLKPMKFMDPATFEALGENHGRDASLGIFRDKRLRISKKGALENLRPLGFIYSTDGATLFFGTQHFSPPKEIDLNLPGIALKWFTDYEINRPPIAITDGSRSWMSQPGHIASWTHIAGLDFNSLTAVEGPCSKVVSHPIDYLADKQAVWFRGERVEGAKPKGACLFGPEILQIGDKVWSGADPLPWAASDGAAIHYAYRTGPPEEFKGTLIHFGDKLIVYEAEQGKKIVARRQKQPTIDTNGQLTDVFRKIDSFLSPIFSTYQPIVSSPQDIATHIETTPLTPVVSDIQAELLDDGQVRITLPSGAVCQQPASCWYTLCCHIWCHRDGLPPTLVPYPSLNWSPDGNEMQLMVIKTHLEEFWTLTKLLAHNGQSQEVEFLLHSILNRDVTSKITKKTAEILVNFPKNLMGDFCYHPPHHDFTVTTNLAVSRFIIQDNWLKAKNFRDRLDVLTVLHGTVINTNKAAAFFKEIIPPLMERYSEEPLPAVRELIAFTLDISLIKGQVDCEVHENFHYAEMVPVIEFCIQNGINTVFNRARLAEAFWALDRDDEAQEVSEQLIAEVGGDYVMPGVYANREIYRTPRLWFLRGKIDLAWRKAKPEVHKLRLSALKAEYKALMKQYEKEPEEWLEVKAIKNDLDRYQEAVEES